MFKPPSSSNSHRLLHTSSEREYQTTLANVFSIRSSKTRCLFASKLPGAVLTRSRELFRGHPQIIEVNHRIRFSPKAGFACAFERLVFHFIQLLPIVIDLKQLSGSHDS